MWASLGVRVSVWVRSSVGVGAGGCRRGRACVGVCVGAGVGVWVCGRASVWVRKCVVFL